MTEGKKEGKKGSRRETVGGSPSKVELRRIEIVD